MFNVSDIKATTLKVVPKSNFFLLNLEKVTIIENHHSVKHLGGMLVFGWTTYSPLLCSYHYLTTYFIVLEDLENQFEVKSYINQFDNSILKQKYIFWFLPLKIVRNVVFGSS